MSKAQFIESFLLLALDISQLIGDPIEKSQVMIHLILKIEGNGSEGLFFIDSSGGEGISEVELGGSEAEV